jgi:hypothetical protein
LYKMFWMSPEIFHALHDLLSLPMDWARPTMFHLWSHWQCFCGLSEGHSHLHKLKIVSHGHFGRFTSSVTPDFRRGTKCISYVRQDQFTHIW